MSETLLPSAAVSSLVGTAFSSQEFAKVDNSDQKNSADRGKHLCHFWFKMDGHFSPGHFLYVNWNKTQA